MDISEVRISGNYKRSIWKVILGIVLFLVVYLFLVGLAAAFLVVCGFAFAFIVDICTGFTCLLAAVGIIAVGIMFFAFFLKIIFIKYRDENPYRVEIFQQDHPRLFKLIAGLCYQIGVRFPRKVFLIHDINAGVFFNSSFWSLFLPLRKNLEIGLGLMNSVNAGEFKAVLAHEFGHFSQKSMRLGSYVYRANRIIHNLVYDYDNWDKTLESWEKIGGIIGYFALGASMLAEAVRPLLRKLYDLINIFYLDMSREAEIHADQIAAIVAGKENAVTSLRRLELGQEAFMRMVRFQDTLSGQKKVAENIYPGHSQEIKFIGNRFKLRFDGMLPVITSEDLEKIRFEPRVKITERWASHPSREEREKNINRMTGTGSKHDRLESWKFLSDPVDWQMKLTNKFNEARYGNQEDFEILSQEKYLASIEAKISKYEIDDFFNRYYTGRFITLPEMDDIAEPGFTGDPVPPLSEIYCEESWSKLMKNMRDHDDLATLMHIDTRAIKNRYFEFDNVKYHRRNIKKVISMLKDELKEQDEELEALDKKAFHLNYAIAASISPDAKAKYLGQWKKIAELQLKIQTLLYYVGKINKYQIEIYSKPRWRDEKLKYFNVELSKFEEMFRQTLAEVIPTNWDDIPEALAERVNKFVSGDISYTKVFSFDMDLFNQLSELIISVFTIFNNKYGKAKKKATDDLLSMYHKLNSGPSR